MGLKTLSNKYLFDQNIFKDEEKSIKNLNCLLGTAMGFNTHSDPWNEDVIRINPLSKYPEWVSNFYEFYKCLDKLLIVA